jgi:predicted RNA-binding Zn-ribbon protein involved in translation (DUF1610 family)
MDRSYRSKIIECAACGRPTPAGSEARRVICPECLALGKEMPRVKQMELLLDDNHQAQVNPVTA